MEVHEFMLVVLFASRKDLRSRREKVLKVVVLNVHELVPIAFCQSHYYFAVLG